MTDEGEWRKATTAEGRVYYWNTITKESRWDKPPSLQGGNAGQANRPKPSKRNRQDTGPKAPKEDQEEGKEKKPRKTTVKMKLNNFIKPDFRDAVSDALETIVSKMSVATHEAYLIANMHVIRCIDDDWPLPDIDQTFFYRCLSLNAKGDARLAETIRRFNELRPEGSVQDNDRLKGFSGILTEVAKEMLTATKNHIVLNFKSRLEKHVRRKYDLSRNEASQFVTYMFLDGWTEEHLVNDQREIKDWLEDINPLELKYLDISTVTSEHLEQLLEKYWDMARLQEELPPDTKGKKTFTLLPTKHDWQLSHVPICKTHLADVMRCVSNQTQWQLLQAIRANQGNLPPNQVRTREQQNGLDRLDNAWRNGRMTNLFFENAWCMEQLWECIFSFKSIESKSKKFGYHITTNGYEVCILFNRVKSSGVDLVTPTLYPTEAVGTVVGDNAELVGFDHYVGIDPGKTFIMNSFDGKDFHKMSSREYYRQIKNTERQKWNENLKKRNQEYANLIKDMPSLKTTRINEFKEAVRVHLERSPRLFAFAQSLSFRKWRFKVDCFRRKTLDKLCSDTVGHLEGTVCVGMGDWSQPKGFKGLPTVPIKRMIKAFKQHAKNKACRTREREERRAARHQQQQPGVVNNGVPRQRDDKVVMVREFNTSAVCSACEHPVKMFHVKHRGVAIRKSKRERLERKGEPVPVPDKAKLTESHQVVRCSNNACSKCWQRDINAARNMQKLLRLDQTGQPRPDVFSRQLPEAN